MRPNPERFRARARSARDKLSPRVGRAQRLNLALSLFLAARTLALFDPFTWSAFCGRRNRKIFELLAGFDCRRQPAGSETAPRPCLRCIFRVAVFGGDGP